MAARKPRKVVITDAVVSAVRVAPGAKAEAFRPVCTITFTISSGKFGALAELAGMVGTLTIEPSQTTIFDLRGEATPDDHGA